MIRQIGIRRYLLVVFLFFAVAAGSARAQSSTEVRIWTTTGGKTTAAMLQGVKGTTVYLKSMTGETTTVEASELSAADREYIANLRRRAKAPAAAAAAPEPAAPAEIQPPRTWTDRKGRTLRAGFVRMDGENVVLARKDGKMVSVPLDSFSAGDHRYLQSLAAVDGAEAAAPAAAPGPEPTPAPAPKPPRTARTTPPPAPEPEPEPAAEPEAAADDAGPIVARNPMEKMMIDSWREQGKSDDEIREALQGMDEAGIDIGAIGGGDEDGGGKVTSPIRRLFGVALLLIGVLACIAGSIWLVIKGFQEGVLWGIAMLFPMTSGIAQLAFVITHWEEAKTPFLINLGGVALAFVGMFVAAAG